jgi:diguanylate cyclase (GGDEF)-like protein
MRTRLEPPLKRAIYGAIASFGAPLGWLGIRYLQGAPPLQEISQQSGLYLYMLIGTLTAFSLFGWYLGTKELYLVKLTLRDALTGLFNVRFFQERLNEEILSAQRFNTPLTLISFDLDHFKRVNDTYGHPVGDQVLIEISHQVAKTLRKHEVLARVGGEEFTALLPQCNLTDGKITAERIRQKIEATRIKTGKGDFVSITLSLGVATLSNNDDSKTFYSRADNALYKAKSNGRNRVEIADE